jgi:hypothetical protein
MNEALGERVYREYRWFALILIALLISFGDRLPSAARTPGQPIASQPGVIGR